MAKLFKFTIFISLLTSLFSFQVTAKKAPAYFISHGGPDFMYMKEFGGFKAVQEIGKDVKNYADLKGIVIVSAHWENYGPKIYVNTEEHTEIIYDFNPTWPAIMFKERYANVGSKEIANRTIHVLESFGIETARKSRGLDHGVWVPFKIAFPPEKFPLNVPIVQVSLYHDEDPLLHLKFGKALGKLREEGIVIIGSGMSVHNLDESYDYKEGEVADYTRPLDNAVVNALTNFMGKQRETALLGLLKRKDLRRAHPTLEHFYPIFIPAAAALEEPCQLLFTSYEGSLAWGQYKCGTS